MSMMMPPGAPPEPMMDGGGGLPPDMMGPPGGGGGGLPPELMAALAGGGGGGDMLAQGPMAGEPTDAAEETADDENDPLSMIREAIALLREAGAMDEDDQRSHQIDKVQADLQKILAGEAAKTSQLRSALGG